MHGVLEARVESQLLHERQRVVAHIGVGHVLRTQLIQRDECHAASLLLFEHRAQPRGDVVCVHQDVEKLVACRHLRACAGMLSVLDIGRCPG